MKQKKFRFFYHYNKQLNKMSVHFKKSCIVADHIVCETLCETKWNKIQPKVVMQGWASEVLVNNGTIHII